MANQLMVVDWTQPREKIVEFLCHVYNIPPTVLHWEYYKVKHYYKLISNHCILNINNKSKFLLKINELSFLEELFEEDKDLFYNKANNLQELLLYLLHYLSRYIKSSDDAIYTLYDMNYDCIMINSHILDKEADTLVFNH